MTVEIAVKGTDRVILVDDADAEVVQKHDWFLSRSTNKPMTRVGNALFHVGDVLGLRMRQLRRVEGEVGWDWRRCCFEPTGDRPGTSRYKGVHLDKRTGIWEVTVRGRYVGCYRTEVEAVEARKRAGR